MLKKILYEYKYTIYKLAQKIDDTFACKLQCIIKFLMERSVHWYIHTIQN